MSYLSIVIFIVVYLCFGAELGYSESSAWYTHFTYMWQHGSWLHLLLNAFSFAVLFNLVKRFFHPAIIMLVIIFMAWAGSYMVGYDQPVVGASGMVYALMGMYFSLVFVGKLKYTKIENLVLSLFSVGVFLLISIFKQNSAGLLHLVCLALGFGAGIFLLWAKIKLFSK